MAAGSTFQFLHAADLHLDSPLRGLVRYPGAPADRLRGATREAFHALVTAALERRVAFVVVAGDVFDGDWADYNSGLWFTTEARRLADAAIPLFLLRGNHDAESRVSKALALPEGVRQFSAKAPETFTLEALGVALHGQSFPVPHVEANLARDYPAPVRGLFNLGVLHTGLEGYEGHGRYAPCTVADLAAKGYDYWALGHIHQREVVHRDPWIVYPGNPQGRHARELGPKGASLVHVADGRVTDVEELVTDVVRWAHLRVPLDRLEDEAAAHRAAQRAMREALAEAEGRLVAARVTFVGATSLDPVLRAAHERVTNEVRSSGLGLSRDLWIEKVLVDTRPLAPPSADDGFGALASRMSSAGLTVDEAAPLARELATLAARLPEAVAAAVRPDDPSALVAAAPSAARYLAALLAAPEPNAGATGEGGEP